MRKTTTYTKWAHDWAVRASPPSLHSVLLVTDGGATQRDHFVASIEAIGAMPGVGFFQIDCLGYGPWLARMHSTLYSTLCSTVHTNPRKRGHTHSASHAPHSCLKRGRGRYTGRMCVCVPIDTLL